MLDMINLEMYLNYLNGSINEEITADYLEEIVDNTKTFIVSILEQEYKIEDGLLSLPIFYSEKHIKTQNDIMDTLIPIPLHNGSIYISKYLLDLFLGENALTYIDNISVDIWDDDEVVGEVHEIPKLIIVADFDKLKEEYSLLKMQKREKLTKTLTRIKDTMS